MLWRNLLCHCLMLNIYYILALNNFTCFVVNFPKMPEATCLPFGSKGITSRALRTSTHRESWLKYALTESTPYSVTSVVSCSCRRCWWYSEIRCSVSVLWYCSLCSTVQYVAAARRKAYELLFIILTCTYSDCISQLKLNCMLDCRINKLSAFQLCAMLQDYVHCLL